MKRVLALLAIVVVFLGLASCGGGGGGGTPSTRVSGVASKGIIKNGLIRIFALNADGSKGALLKETSTDANGAYSASFSYSGAVLVEASGSYTDEATGATKTIPADAPLRAAVEQVSGTAAIAVTPLTELAVQRMEDPVSHNVTVAQIAATNAAVSALFQVDIVGTMPVDALSVTPGASNAQKEHALVLAAVSQLMQDKGEDLPTVIATLKSAIGSDGTLDTTAAQEFRGALATFTASAENQTGIVDLLETHLADIGSVTRNVRLAVTGTAGSIGGLQFQVVLPPGVTVQADSNGNVVAGSLATASGVFAEGVYASANAWKRGRVGVIVASPTGFAFGPFLTLTCQVAPGAAPANGDFQLPVLGAYDSGQAPIDPTGLTVTATLL
ncbi:hypothetical protein [Geomesophilobacter sediminis]|uniref:Uncharacterized protein n=1 Tax=Geomesophilobacter sediminis TaxID=2798584 RepID=A0A8J7IPA7_9BACT|nr:hypothetical protein [Geomesophilobacter sediminis]MBJ6725343.1 hypothetical protein [Geomesophilobacter sediminis]